MQGDGEATDDISLSKLEAQDLGVNYIKTEYTLGSFKTLLIKRPRGGGVNQNQRGTCGLDASAMSKCPN